AYGPAPGFVVQNSIVRRARVIVDGQRPETLYHRGKFLQVTLGSVGLQHPSLNFQFGGGGLQHNFGVIRLRAPTGQRMLVHDQTICSAMVKWEIPRWQTEMARQQRSQKITRVVIGMAALVSQGK